MTTHPRVIKRLLITRHDKIGDFVLSLPLCKAIRESRPDIRIAVLVSRVNYDFAKALPFIDEVLLYEKSFRFTLARIKDGKFDASISCFIDLRLGALLWFAGIKKRVAPATKLAQLFFNHRVAQRRSRVAKTEWQYNMDLGSVLFPGDSLAFSPPLLAFPDLAPKNRVVFHPGFGGSSDGNLKLSDYMRLARHASTIPGMEVVFTFGPDDTAAYQQIESALDFPATLIQSKMNLIEFCKFLAQAKLFVSTSTGPMHLAGAVNTPTLSFFGSNRFASAQRWAAISNIDRQHNFMVGENYPTSLVTQIEQEMLDVLNGPSRPTGAHS